MAKLVVLSAGMTGRTHELKVDKTTVGRVEDNTFQIAEPSVSSHHCEILLRGADIVVHDLNSTNGTYINGEKISESILKAGQILRLGQIEMRLEVETAAPSKKVDQTMVMSRGVSLNELEQGPRAGFDTASKGFSKKDNKVNRFFIIGGIVLGVVLLLLVLYIYHLISKSGGPGSANGIGPKPQLASSQRATSIAA
jgi:pSer/pThr/pTyr-binding forkhead associated (FHA) protein